MQAAYCVVSESRLALHFGGLAIIWCPRPDEALAGTQVADAWHTQIWKGLQYISGWTSLHCITRAWQTSEALGLIRMRQDAHSQMCALFLMMQCRQHSMFLVS